jgi:hypothetical protein
VLLNDEHDEEVENVTFGHLYGDLMEEMARITTETSSTTEL